MTTTSGTSTLPDLTPLLKSFSNLGIHFSGSSGGQNTSFTTTYTINYTSATTYKLNIVANSTGTPQPITAWILKNGTVVAANYVGQNLTGSSAQGIVYGYMFPFVLELQFNTELGAFTSAVGVHKVGTGTLTINQTTLAVTNYAASSLPLTFNYCGSNFTLNEFALQTGIVQGTSVTLITQFHLKGITTVNGTPETVDFTMAIVSLVKA